MIRILCAITLVVSATALVQQPAQASEAPWCLIGKNDGRCYYNSLEECRRDMAGGGSFCNPNPAYRGAEQPRRQTKHPGRQSQVH
jgi:hypothetical protein